jgi:peptidoglycan/xylan/chitin deacetylase (PgdA/CDA1 family)
MRHLSPHEIRRQAVESKDQLEGLLGVRIGMFAYPYGQLDDVSKLTKRILYEAGYEIAVSTRWGTLQSSNELLELRRIFFNEEDNLEDLRAKVEGRYDWFALKERIGYMLRLAKGRFTAHKLVELNSA